MRSRREFGTIRGMGEIARRRWIVSALMILAAIVFLTGIQWGLPSRAVDPFLFGDQPVWSGEKIVALAPKENDARGADVDANPLGNISSEIILNQTDEQKAEIIRRFRLFSYQPDEMITFKSLARLKENHGDPRLYQYGGLWIYPVGVLLKIASMAGFVDLHGGPAGQEFYLDHPEAFGRFYIVARFYSAMWGVVGVWAVFAITRRFAKSLLVPIVAAVSYIAMPVVINMAHEAKPHLAGAVLMMLAVLAAMKFVETGFRRFAFLSGALCGAATGMVISSLAIFLVLPVMGWVRFREIRKNPHPNLLPEYREKGLERQLVATCTLAIAAGVGIYCITNPFVPFNFFFHRDVLESNLKNSTAMYAIGAWGAGIWWAGELIVAGGSLISLAGIVGVVNLLIKKVKPKLGWLIAAPATAIAIQFAALAAGKPGEYARFAIFLDVALMIVFVVGAYEFSKTNFGLIFRLAVVVAIIGAAGWPCLRGFIRDSRPDTARLKLARTIQNWQSGDVKKFVLLKEPAPYNCPPIDLFRSEIVLMPAAAVQSHRQQDAIVIFPTMLFPELMLNQPRFPQISWADKAVDLR